MDGGKEVREGKRRRRRMEQTSPSQVACRDACFTAHSPLITRLICGVWLPALGPSSVDASPSASGIQMVLLLHRRDSRDERDALPPSCFPSPHASAPSVSLRRMTSTSIDWYSYPRRRAALCRELVWDGVWSEAASFIALFGPSC